MSPPGRPKGKYRSAQHEGTPVSLRALLAAMALAASGSSHALNLAGNGEWVAFDVDELSAVSGGLEWIDIGDGTALTLQFNIDAGYFGVLTVVDSGFAGDRFRVVNGDTVLGETSAAGSSFPDSLGLDFDAALADSRYSRNQFVLAAGSYGITGTLVESVLLDGLPLNATVGGARLEVSLVPEPATWATLALGLGLLGAAVRRRPS
jgi:PEP-CTERM motif